jgi:organic radical activating enzyme
VIFLERKGKFPMALTIFVTNICPVECEHCAYSSTRDGSWLPLKYLKKICNEISESKFVNEVFINVTGGEPFSNLFELEKRLDLILNYFEPWRIVVTTSGFWGVTKKSTKKNLNFLNKKSIKEIHLSTDRFHLKRVPLKNIENILSLSKDLEFRVILKPLLDTKSDFLVEPLMKLALKYKPPIVFCVLDPLGKARKVDKKIMKSVELSQDFMEKLEKRRNMELTS